MKRNSLWILLVVMFLWAGVASPANAQNKAGTPASVSAEFAEQVFVEVADNKFHRAVLKTATEMVRAGTMRRADLIRLRLAMLSPAFRKQAEDLAVIQMAASGSDNIPVDAAGVIDRASIDWDALLAFIEKLIPIILQLIEIFGGVTAMDLHTLPNGTMYAAVTFETGCLLVLGA